MEKVISGEQEKLNEQREQVRVLKGKISELQSIIHNKDHEINQAKDIEGMLKSEKERLLGQIQDMDRQITQMKAREYDKVDYIKRHAELESKIAYFTAEKELHLKDKLRQEKEILSLGRDKQQL